MRSAQGLYKIGLFNSKVIGAVNFIMRISGFNAFAGDANRLANASTDPSDSPSFASVIAATTGASGKTGDEDVRTTDFTQMTRQELLEWVNAKIISGEMSLDGSEGFVGMTIKIPVDGTYAGLDSAEPVNFMQTAQDGITWAQHHGDTDSFKILQAALATMQRYQGEVTRIDPTA
jgi:hypothetical protein